MLWVVGGKNAWTAEPAFIARTSYLLSRLVAVLLLLALLDSTT
jgi:hypothetical protein